MAVMRNIRDGQCRELNRPFCGVAGARVLSPTESRSYIEAVGHGRKHTHTSTMLADGRTLQIDLLWGQKPSERQTHVYFNVSRKGDS